MAPLGSMGEVPVIADHIFFWGETVVRGDNHVNCADCPPVIAVHSDGAYLLAATRWGHHMRTASVVHDRDGMVSVLCRAPDIDIFGNVLHVG